MISPLRAKILDAGFAENEHLLALNDCLEDPAPRYPGSRMFKWPVHVDRYEDRLTVCHMLMTFEPFVQRVIMTLGAPVEVEPEPAGCHGIYHHGVDLATDHDHIHLIATAHYVTPRVIMRGATIGVMTGRLSPANARTVLAELDAPETLDRSALNLSHAGGMLHPTFVDGKWTVNLHSRRDPIGEVWAAIHGVEDGWFQRNKHGYHTMSPAGLSRHMGVPMP